MVASCGCVAHIRWSPRSRQLGLRPCADHHELSQEEIEATGSVMERLIAQEPGTTPGAILASFLERIETGAIA